MKKQIKYAHIRKKVEAEFVAIIFFSFIIPREDGFVHTLAVFHRYLSSQKHLLRAPPSWKRDLKAPAVSSGFPTKGNLFVMYAS